MVIPHDCLKVKHRFPGCQGSFNCDKLCDQGVSSENEGTGASSGDNDYGAWPYVPEIKF
jgi:hypothetical protein